MNNSQIKNSGPFFRKNFHVIIFFDNGIIKNQKRSFLIKIRIISKYFVISF